MANLKITLKKSIIGCTQKQIATVKALGLKKIGSNVEQQDNPQIRGMIKVVSHLISVEQV